MKIIKETDRDVVRMVTYHGICDACATPLDYPDDLIVVIVHKGEEIECPPSIAMLADRLGVQQMRHDMAFNRPLPEILGNIYLMGFVHAAELSNKSKAQERK